MTVLSTYPKKYYWHKSKDTFVQISITYAKLQLPQISSKSADLQRKESVLWMLYAWVMNVCFLYTIYLFLPDIRIAVATLSQFYINLKWTDLFPLTNLETFLSFEHWTNCGIRNCSIQVTSFLINIDLLGMICLAYPPPFHPKGKQQVCIFFIKYWTVPKQNVRLNKCWVKTAIK